MIAVSITVKYEELQSTAGQLRAGREEISTNLTRCRTLVDGLVASGFVTGTASVRFQQSFLQWNDGATTVIQSVERMSTFLDQAVARHQQLDSELGGAASGADAELNDSTAGVGAVLGGAAAGASAELGDAAPNADAELNDRTPNADANAGPGEAAKADAERGDATPHADTGAGDAAKGEAERDDATPNADAHRPEPEAPAPKPPPAPENT